MKQIINFMIIFILLYYFINCILCCYVNKTIIETSYISTVTQSVSVIPIACITNYITSTDYSGICADGRLNQGSRCRSTIYVTTTSICSPEKTGIYSSFISTPTIFQKIHEYKLDCKNKSSSSLINIY